jgi:two-component system KDP operon response regulator KdpE
VTKPFGTSELLARIRTALRHSPKGREETNPEVEKMSIGNLSIDYKKRIVKVEEREIHLTPIEYKIIVLLSHNIGKVLTHDYIAKEIWGPYINETQTLRVNMANIRRKIEINPAEPKYILTEVGVGYRMIEELV